MKTEDVRKFIVKDVNGNDIKYTGLLSLKLECSEQQILEALDDIDRIHEAEKKADAEGYMIETCPRDLTAKVMFQMSMMDTMRMCVSEKKQRDYIDEQRKERWEKMCIKEQPIKIKRIL
jgi:hypothetical protein